MAAEQRTSMTSQLGPAGLSDGKHQARLGRCTLGVSNANMLMQRQSYNDVHELPAIRMRQRNNHMQQSILAMQHMMSDADDAGCMSLTWGMRSGMATDQTTVLPGVVLLFVRPPLLLLSQALTAAIVVGEVVLLMPVAPAAGMARDVGGGKVRPNWGGVVAAGDASPPLLQPLLPPHRSQAARSTAQPGPCARADKGSKRPVARTSPAHRR
jgi:hypothetical protein